MPVVVEFTEAVITLRLIGEYSHDDMRDAFLTGMGSPATTVGGLLIDVRQSLSLRNRPAAEVRSMSRWWTLRAQRFARRMALVADPGTLEHGMARLSYPEIP
ncbi:MAG: hypothetical protein ABJE47_16525, partial [bacterium]